MEEREVSSNKRQKVQLRLEDVISRKTEDHLLYDVFNVLMCYLEDSTIDILLSISHSMRCVILNSSVVDVIKTKVSNYINWMKSRKQHLDLRRLHGIYELKQSCVISTNDYDQMKQQLEKYASPAFSKFNLACENEQKAKEIEFSWAEVVRLPDFEFTTLVFRCATNRTPLPTRMVGRAQDWEHYRNFNWNDLKLILKTLLDADHGVSSRFIAYLAMCGEPVETLQRFLKLPQTAKRSLMSSKTQPSLDVVLRNLRAVAHLPEIVKPIMEEFIQNRPDMLQPDTFVFSEQLLEKIQFGDFFTKNDGNNCAAFLKTKNNRWFFVLVCKLPYFQTDKCCDLWKACSTRKHHRTTMIQYTPIMKHISKLDDAKNLLPLIQELKQTELDVFWKQQFPQLSIETRANIVFQFYETTPPNSLFFCSEPERSFAECKASHSLSLYLLKCEQIFSASLLAKIESSERARKLWQITQNIMHSK